MKNLRQNKDFRIFVRTLFNATVAFAWTLLLWIEWSSAVIVAWLAIPFLNALTKFVNTKRFGDIGVSE